jgi:catalase
MQEQAPKLTTASGRPYVENDNTMTVGPRGPILLQDYILHEKMADVSTLFRTKNPMGFEDLFISQWGEVTIR